MGVVAFHQEAKQVLDRVLPSFWGPATNLPTKGGSVVQCAVLWPTAGVLGTRADGVHAARRTDTLRVTFVGPTVLDALAAADKGRRALAGARLSVAGHGSGPVSEGGFQGADPQPEPGTDPVRCSVTIQFDAISKET